MAEAFLSYAREDIEFARRLHEALAGRGWAAAWDQDHEVIPFSSLYEEEIKDAITAADKVVFVITPAWLASRPCAWELQLALQVGKAIVPVLRAEVPDGEVPDVVGRRNWIFFTDDGRFDESLGNLLQALNADLDWAKSHKQLQVRAQDWFDGSMASSKLLRGSDLR